MRHLPEAKETIKRLCGFHNISQLHGNLTAPGMYRGRKERISKPDIYDTLHVDKETFKKAWEALEDAQVQQLKERKMERREKAWE